MITKFISTCGLLAFAFCSNAQTFTPVKDAADTQNKITAATQRINTIQCDFKQEKSMSILKDKVISKGKFYFKKNDKVRLEYLHPVKNLIVMNNGKMLIHNEKKTSQTDTHKSHIFHQLNNIIIGSISGTLFNTKDFTVSFSESASLVKAELKPVSKTLQNFLETIVLVLDKKDFTATRLEMNEPGGDNTILMFSAKEINAAVDDSLFVVK